MNVIEIAAAIEMHRQSVTKYLEMLMVAGQVEMRTFGPAKVYYLSQRLPLSAMLSISSDMIILLDRDLKIINANDAFLARMSAAREDILNKVIGSIYFPLEFQPSIIPFIADAILGKESRIEAVYRKKGKEQFFDVKFLPVVFDDGQPGATVILEDVTGQRRAEREREKILARLKESDQSFRILIHNLRSGVVLVEASGRFSIYNPAYLQIFGFADEDMKGLNIDSPEWNSLLAFDKDGNKQILSGHGIGDNYWDLVPFGAKDTYATILYYEALHCMARIERYVLEHPEWNVPVSESAFNPQMLIDHAADVKSEGNKLFWNPETDRFVPGIDMDGQIHDYGMTSLNMEAIYYDFATAEHAKSILRWLDGERTVDGDTSTGADIYHWRFAPRATTKRNIEFYFWAWSGPETIPWGGQVQDGGAVLGFSYHDLMARLRILGPDDAAARLAEIVKWFDEVQAAGGYRKYYDGTREGTLQGGGTAGGLGLDCEFMESVLVPQVMIDGFMGFEPLADGFELDPKLPSDWPELQIDRIRFHDSVLTIRATKGAIEVTNDAPTDEPCLIRLPDGEWTATYPDDPNARIDLTPSGAFAVDWSKHGGVVFRPAAPALGQ
jgi:PAS domain S-box-containing protein